MISPTYPPWTSVAWRKHKQASGPASFLQSSASPYTRRTLPMSPSSSPAPSQTDLSAAPSVLRWKDPGKRPKQHLRDPPAGGHSGGLMKSRGKLQGSIPLALWALSFVGKHAAGMQSKWGSQPFYSKCSLDQWHRGTFRNADSLAQPRAIEPESTLQQDAQKIHVNIRV